LRTSPGRVEPEVWFRIVHFAQAGHHGVPVAPYREQTVEIALGSKGTFENGNIGALTRLAPPDQVLRDPARSEQSQTVQRTEDPPSHRTSPQSQ
jgi:hypothetical protein